MKRLSRIMMTELMKITVRIKSIKIIMMRMKKKRRRRRRIK